MKGLDKIKAARVSLLFNNPFFGAIATQMKLVATERVPTMGVDGVHLFVNTEFSDKLTKEECRGVVAHEVMHIVLLTHLRMGHKDHSVWNMATDYAINLLLVAENFTLPKGGLLDQKYKDWSAEKIYLYLMENPDEQPKTAESEWNVGGVSPAGTMGEDGEEGANAEMTDVQAKAEESKVKGQIQAAALQARKAGKLPANMDRLVNEICAPKANWREILQRFVSEKALNDWDYATTHTRMMQQYGIVYPQLGGEALGKLAIIVDTSGSVDEKQLAQFAGEISDILDNYECTITVIYCDTQVNRVDTYVQDDLPLRLHAVGGGGTLGKPAYDFVEAQLEDTAAIIHYTDSWLFDWAQITQPEAPVLMACTYANPDASTPDWIDEIVDISDQ